jgi:dihydroorotate dehydrogenase electron transfer subunit
MNNPLHAACYADQALSLSVPALENVRLATDTYRLRLACPEIARRILPGQFLMVRISACNDPLIGRALALYDVVSDSSGQAIAVDVVYVVKGKFTQRLKDLRIGQMLDVLGPLGNGFAPRATRHLVMVAGGIGQTPFLAVAQEYLGKRQFGHPSRTAPRAERVTLCYGARRADLLAGIDDFERVGVQVEVCTDDGSRGRRGLVSELLDELLQGEGQRPHVVCCGPEPMMEAVAEVARRHQTPCEVSLETPMACGIGICFSCVARVRDEQGGWDYKRTCVEGPVFDARSIVW